MTVQSRTVQSRPEEAIFEQARERTNPHERAVLVEQACAGDESLKRRVLELLAAHDASQGPLDVPPPGLGATQASSVERPGTQIGPYKLLQQIGEGGFGIVFMAEQLEPVRRRVALKVIKPGMDTRQVIARFEAERQALAVMDHPNIAKVLDAGTTESGRPYFVMELVRGIPITQYCDESNLPVRERLELFATVCQAIQHAHTKGIIHRDIKPTNVLVTRQDGQPVVKVIDFGVAKAMGQQLTDKTLFTDFAQMIGTPIYMSPEQAELSSNDIDTRSDIYSLGVLLYELLTGTTPVSKEQLKQAAFDEIRRIIREEEPPKPSTRISTAEAAPSIAAQRHTEPAKLAKLVRGELDWIVMKALEKDRNRRYETANGFAMDVQRYLEDEPVQACPPSASYRLRKFARRHRVALGMTGMAAALLTFALVTLAFANVRINDALTTKTEALTEKTSALTAKTRALDDLSMAKQDLESANLNLKQAVEALSDEQNKTKLALDQERVARYSQSIALAYRELEAGLSTRAEYLLAECPDHLRGWEWNYLKRQCHRELVAFRGGGTPHVAFIDDSALVASITLDRRVNRWNSKDGGLVSQFRLPTMDFYGFHGARLNSNGHLVAAVVDDQRIQLHDCESGKEISSIQIQEGKFSRGQFELSPGGERLAAAISLRRDGIERTDTVRMWEVGSGRELFKLSGSDYGALVFGSDGKDLILCKGNDVVVHDATSGTAKVRWRCWDPTAAYPPVGQVMTSVRSRLAMWDERYRRLRIWDLRDGKLLTELQSGSSAVSQMVFHPNGLLLAAAFEDGNIKIFNTEAGKEWLAIRGHGLPVLGLAFSRDGSRLLSAGHDGMVKVWDSSAFAQKMPPGTLVFRMGAADLSEPVRCVSFSSDGKYLAAGSPVLGITIWQTDTRTKKFFRLPAAFTNHLALSPDGQRVATGGVDGVARIYHPQMGTEIVACQGHTGTIEDVSFSPDGTWLATACGVERGDGTVRLWNAATGKEVKSWTVPSAWRLAFSPDGLHLAAVTNSIVQPTARLWDVATGAELWRTTKEFVPATALAFSRDGKRLAVATSVHTVKTLDAKTGEEQWQLQGCDSSAGSLAFHPDGNRLAAMTPDGSLVIWDLLNGREVLTLHREPNKWGSVAFSPDGRWLARGTSDGAVEILDGTPWPETK